MHDKKELRRQILLVAQSIGVLIVGMLVLASLSHIIVPGLFSTKYAEASLVFQSLTIASIFFMCSIPANISLLALGRSKFIGLVSIVQVSVLIGLSLWLVPIWGAQGAAFALGCAYFSSFIMSTSYAFKTIFS